MHFVICHRSLLQRSSSFLFTFPGFRSNIPGRRHLLGTRQFPANFPFAFPLPSITHTSVRYFIFPLLSSSSSFSSYSSYSCSFSSSFSSSFFNTTLTTRSVFTSSSCTGTCMRLSVCIGVYVYHWVSNHACTRPLISLFIFIFPLFIHLFIYLFIYFFSFFPSVNGVHNYRKADDEGLLDVSNLSNDRRHD